MRPRPSQLSFLPVHPHSSWGCLCPICMIGKGNPSQPTQPVELKQRAVLQTRSEGRKALRRFPRRSTSNDCSFQQVSGLTPSCEVLLLFPELLNSLGASQGCRPPLSQVGKA